MLIVASAHPAELEKAVSELLADLRAETIRADVADGVVGVDEPLADGAVALVNRGTLGAVVAPDGTLWMSLLRACSSWPSGVWIDGDRRTAPDGSSFAWQHWSHTFSYALLSSGEDWRAGRFNARAEDYNHDLVAVVRDGAVAGPAASPDLVSVGAPNVTLTALKPYGNPLASGRPGAPAAGRDVTVRLRETDGRPARALVRFAAGIEAAWRGDILEQAPGAPLTVRDGVAFVHLGPFETVTVRVRPGGTPCRPLADVAGRDRPAAGAPPEPAQPVYTRYWLHNKGPAPAGNVPVAVHLTPTRVTLRGDDGEAGRLRLTVACGQEPAAGEVELLVPDGLVAEVDGAPVAGTPLPYRLADSGFAAWDVTVRAAPGAADGRYFVAARIRDELGQQLEDAALVTIGEPGGPDASLPPEELFSRLQSDVQALAAEADLAVLTPELRLAPGSRGELTVRVASHLASSLRGEVQLISPIGTWETTAPWTQAVDVSPGGTATVSFGVTVPGDGRARLAVVAPGQADVLRPRPLLPGNQPHHQLAPGGGGAGAAPAASRRRGGRLCRGLARPPARLRWRPARARRGRRAAAQQGRDQHQDDHVEDRREPERDGHAVREDLVLEGGRGQAGHRVRQRVPCGGAEHGDQYRQAQRPADLLHDVDHAGGGAGVLGAHAHQRDRRQRHEDDAHADAEQQHRLRRRRSSSWSPATPGTARPSRR